MTFENMWHGLGMAAAVAIAGCALMAIVSPKKVNGYYLSDAQGSRNKGYCVLADIDWHVDPTVFCSDDVNKSLDVVVKGNASLGKR